MECRHNRFALSIGMYARHHRYDIDNLSYAYYVMTTEAWHERLGITTAYSGKINKVHKPLD